MRHATFRHRKLSFLLSYRLEWFHSSHLSLKGFVFHLTSHTRKLVLSTGAQLKCLRVVLWWQASKTFQSSHWLISNSTYITRWILCVCVCVYSWEVRSSIWPHTAHEYTNNTVSNLTFHYSIGKWDGIYNERVYTAISARIGIEDESTNILFSSRAVSQWNSVKPQNTIYRSFRGNEIHCTRSFVCAIGKVWWLFAEEIPSGRK